MKVPRETVSQMASDMAEVVGALCSDIPRLRAMGETVDSGILWNLWHQVHAERAYGDDHPRLRDRRRIFAHDASHSLYPHDTNDTTMTTALRAAWKQILAKL